MKIEKDLAWKIMKSNKLLLLAYGDTTIEATIDLIKTTEEVMPDVYDLSRDKIFKPKKVKRNKIRYDNGSVLEYFEFDNAQLIDDMIFMKKTEPEGNILMCFKIMGKVYNNYL